MAGFINRVPLNFGVPQEFQSIVHSFLRDAYYEAISATWNGLSVQCRRILRKRLNCFHWHTEVFG